MNHHYVGVVNKVCSDLPLAAFFPKIVKKLVSPINLLTLYSIYNAIKFEKRKTVWRLNYYRIQKTGVKCALSLTYDNIISECNIKRVTTLVTVVVTLIHGGRTIFKSIWATIMSNIILKRKKYSIYSNEDHFCHENDDYSKLFV